MSEAASARCTSCQGAGEIGTDNGPTVCPDCFGEGRTLDSLERTEWRLRDIERVHRGPSPHGCDGEVRWLIFELRRTREALVRILSRCQDGDANGLAAEVQYTANQALGLYEIEPS
jgi:hypothetical protein